MLVNLYRNFNAYCICQYDRLSNTASGTVSGCVIVLVDMRFILLCLITLSTCVIIYDQNNTWSFVQTAFIETRWVMTSDHINVFIQEKQQTNAINQPSRGKRSVCSPHKRNYRHSNYYCVGMHAGILLCF